MEFKVCVEKTPILPCHLDALFILESPQQLKKSANASLLNKLLLVINPSLYLHVLRMLKIKIVGKSNVIFLVLAGQKSIRHINII
jgi:hypothetical protein